jgi:hypothetical protein
MTKLVMLPASFVTATYRPARTTFVHSAEEPTTGAPLRFESAQLPEQEDALSHRVED